MCVKAVVFKAYALLPAPTPTRHKGSCWSRGPVHLGGGRGHRVPFLGGMAPSGMAPASTNRPHRRLLWSCGWEEINVMGTAPSSSAVSAWRNLCGWLGWESYFAQKGRGKYHPPGMYMTSRQTKGEAMCRRATLLCLESMLMAPGTLWVCSL